MYEKKKKANWLSDRKITVPKTRSHFLVFFSFFSFFNFLSFFYVF